MYAQLQSISLASPTGATITHNVVGFVRSPPPAGRPNAMGDVTLITPLGTIRISGSNLFYTDDSIYNGIYGQFGFTTPASTGRRSLLQASHLPEIRTPKARTSQTALLSRCTN